MYPNNLSARELLHAVIALMKLQEESEQDFSGVIHQLLYATLASLSE